MKPGVFFCPKISQMKEKAKILDQEGINRAIMRIAHEIIEKNKGKAKWPKADVFAAFQAIETWTPCFFSQPQGMIEDAVCKNFKDTYYAINKAIVDMGGWDDDTVVACNPDVIVWQRQVEDHQLAAMQRWRQKLPKTKKLQCS